MYLRAPGELGDSLDDVGDAERRHEESDRRLVDQGPQDGAFDGEPEEGHDRQGRGKGADEGHAPFRKADEGQCREQQHRALREVEHAGGLVDQHEADRDQRIHDPGQQTADQHLDEEGEIGIHAPASKARPR